MGSTAFPARLSVPPVARSAARELRQRGRPHQYRGANPSKALGIPYSFLRRRNSGPASAGPFFLNCHAPRPTKSNARKRRDRCREAHPVVQSRAGNDLGSEGAGPEQAVSETTGIERQPVGNRVACDSRCSRATPLPFPEYRDPRASAVIAPPGGFGQAKRPLRGVPYRDGTGLTVTFRPGRVLRLTDRPHPPKGLSRHILAPAGLRYSTVPLCVCDRSVLLVLARPTRRLTKKSGQAPIRDRHQCGHRVAVTVFFGPLRGCALPPLRHQKKSEGGALVKLFNCRKRQ